MEELPCGRDKRQVYRRHRAKGIATFIDGAHAPGQIPLNLKAIAADFYVCNCHKWPCAPKGSAFLHARTEHHSMLDATVISWRYADGTGGHYDPWWLASGEMVGELRNNHPINPWVSHLPFSSNSNTYAGDFNVKGLM